MDDKELTPSESLALISNVILDAKSRFRDNGFSFIFLGICIFIASSGQFILLKMHEYEINYYPYFIMPFAGIYTYYYYAKKRKAIRSKNIIGNALSIFSAIMGFNFMILGFFFWEKLGIGLFPVMLVLIALWTILLGVLIKYRIFIGSGTVINILAYVAFFIDMEYQPLLFAISSIFALVIPGIFLNQSRKEDHV